MVVKLQTLIIQMLLTQIFIARPNQIIETLDSNIAFFKKNSSANGKVVGIVGFCWGGSQFFNYATPSPEIEAAIVCYGTGPKKTDGYKNIQVPIYGFYGGNDNRVNATIPSSQKAMQDSEIIFESIIYDGTGEAEGSSEANEKAREDGLVCLKKILQVFKSIKF